MTDGAVMDDARLAEKYFHSRFWVPGPVLQTVLNTYIEWDHRLRLLLARGRPNTDESAQELAEQSGDLMRLHYDMPLALFENFLGPSMKYSMALWETGAQNLEDAQEAMQADLCRKAGIRDGDTVLDVGCGFGSFAEHVLRAYPNCRVYGLTLSRTQCEYIRARQNEPGHVLATDRFALIQDDFNTVRFDRRFDRIVSIGFFEHVSNLGRALEKLREFIAPQGTAFLHYIVYRRPLDRMGHNGRQNSFIARYIFPGGRIWFDEELYKYQEHFRIAEHWFLGGSNYRRTLEAWLENFHRNRGRIQAEGDLPESTLKLWDLYLRACVGVFHAAGGRFYGNGQYLLRPV